MYDSHTLFEYLNNSQEIESRWSFFFLLKSFESFKIDIPINVGVQFPEAVQSTGDIKQDYGLSITSSVLTK